MPEITCVKCGTRHGITHQGYLYGNQRVPNGKVRGVLTCYAPQERGRAEDTPCHGETLFELTQNAISWAPGQLFREGLAPHITSITRGLFAEALQAYYGGAYKGTVALCRSAIEQALDEKNVRGRDLWAKIENCPDDILGSSEKTKADSARLDGRDALHHLLNVTPSDGLGA